MHPPTPDIKTAVVITAQVKHVSTNERERSTPSQANLVRIANRVRERLRPRTKDFKDNQSYNFFYLWLRPCIVMCLQIVHNFIPAGFYRKDVDVIGCRHLIFATDEQI
ncbi:hypothetical protein KUTeg_006108 [Tegillarca granosa]|uniref:Uncharacterized protein n=1 Tax=Tegillarca granosa TaxID=220873 RepID=A0ABQ9FFM2_TEGGR|nr:hypothetical protein KUTeg_006108 [Tegillarca granosa]